MHMDTDEPRTSSGTRDDAGTRYPTPTDGHVASSGTWADQADQGGQADQAGKPWQGGQPHEGGQGAPPISTPPAAAGTVGPGVPPRRRRVAVGLAGLALVAGAAGGGVGVLASGGGSSSPATITTVTSDSGSPTVQAASSGTIASAAAKIEPSVVTITVTGSSSDIGSGIIVRSDGYILTNNHVISSGGTITVQRYNGQQYTATVVGQDASNDLAVVKIDATGLPAATFADSSKIAVGDLTVAVGSPLGLSNTVTSGVVSALNRTITTSDSSPSPFGGGGATSDSGATIKNAIQTDASINPGNSGGALVNASGQVIGVTSAIASTSTSSFGQQSESGSIGVGFAIPSNTASTVAAQLISSGSTSSSGSNGSNGSTIGLTGVN
jgi:putative serine protease PepD